MVVKLAGLILILSIVWLAGDNFVLLINESADIYHLYTTIEKAMCK